MRWHNHRRRKKNPQAPIPLRTWTRVAAMANKDPERDKSRAWRAEYLHREGVKAYEMAEVDRHVVSEKRARAGNATGDSQLIDERRDRLDDTVPWEVASRRMMKLFARSATAGTS